MTVLFAFLHHLAAFALVGAIAVEFALVRGPLTVSNARRLLRTDQVLGAAAGILVIAGLARVFLFEKGGGYYLQNGWFLLKFALFVGLGLLSVGPTRAFLAWRAPLAQNRAPDLGQGDLARIRCVVQLELAGVVVILLCAVLMARGYGGF